MKEMTGKEPKFNPTQVIDILLRKWFLLELEIGLLELDPDNEDNDSEFFDVDLEMKCLSKAH
jgi:hypothetical protein